MYKLLENYMTDLKGEVYKIQNRKIDSRLKWNDGQNREENLKMFYNIASKFV